MNKPDKKIEGTIDAWETRELGAEAAFAKVDTSITADALDDVAGLQMISIRLQKTLIDELKMISEMHGLGYQPLIKQILRRFADAEIKKFANEYAHKMAEERARAITKNGNDTSAKKCA